MVGHNVGMTYWEDGKAVLRYARPATHSPGICGPQNGLQKPQEASSHFQKETGSGFPKIRSGFPRFLQSVLGPTETKSAAWCNIEASPPSQWVIQLPEWLQFGAKLEQWQVAWPKLWHCTWGHNPSVGHNHNLGNTGWVNTHGDVTVELFARDEFETILLEPVKTQKSCTWKE